MKKAGKITYHRHVAELVAYCHRVVVQQTHSSYVAWIGVISKNDELILHALISDEMYALRYVRNVDTLAKCLNVDHTVR